MSASTTYRDPNHELIERCRQQDEKAQWELYETYYKAMYNTAVRLVTDRMEAEDIMQEAFLDAFRKIDTYRAEASFGAWLKRIVVNRSLNAVKRHRWMEDVDQIPEIVEETIDNPTWDIDAVKKGIAALPNGYRVILSLYLLEGYDHEEIAQVMKISAATSRSQFARAKVRLKQYLKTECHVG